MGKSETRQTREIINSRFTPEEKRKLEILAKELGLSMSGLVRMALFKLYEEHMFESIHKK